MLWHLFLLVDVRIEAGFNVADEDAAVADFT